MATEDSIEDSLDSLWESVINLAMPAVGQLEILSAIGDSSAVDELALEFEDKFWAAQAAFERNRVTPEEYAALNKLNARLDSVSGGKNASLWTTDALKHDTRWSTIRRLAKEALTERQISRAKSSVV